MSRVLLGVTGGIAAYKACDLCRLLVKEGHDVVPLVTPGAERFVTAETFRALARRPPADDVYLHLTRADLLMVAPCTANTLAKLAHGLSDNILTEAAVAHRGPVLVAPAMNPRMWSHPATRANAEALRARGVVLVGPDEGETAEGELGVGRMAEPDEILRTATSLLFASNSLLQGKTVLVSAGGTREPLDAVRFVGNRSSGRMGVALAAEARRRGADVTLVAWDLAVPAPGGVELVETPPGAHLGRGGRGGGRAGPRRDADGRRSRARGDRARRGSRRRRHGRRRGRLPACRGARGEAYEGLGRLDARARADDRRALGPGRTAPRWPAPRRLRRRDGRGRPRSRARQAGTQGRRPLRLQRRLPPGHRARRDRQRGDPPRGIRRADGCESTEGGDRSGDPRRGGDPDRKWLSAR